MIGRSHPLSPTKGALVGLSIGFVLWAAAMALALCVAHDRASRGELPVLAREVTR